MLTRTDEKGLIEDIKDGIGIAPDIQGASATSIVQSNPINFLSDSKNGTEKPDLRTHLTVYVPSCGLTLSPGYYRMKTLNRGDIVRVDFLMATNPTSEFDSPHPAVVIQNDTANNRLETVTVVPVMTNVYDGIIMRYVSSRIVTELKKRPLRKPTSSQVSRYVIGLSTKRSGK
jgi:mRNA-degrading endonuclease toxin of MazEF toxin-antitoxin module